jgi:hypothetical protein
VAPFVFPTIPEAYLVALIVVFFLTAAGGLVYNLRIMRRRSYRFWAIEDGEAVSVREARAEAAQVLDETVARLGRGSEYRKTVLECYRLLSNILERRSEISGEALTAREFSRLASEKLGLEDSPHLPTATRLFEFARYSEREITKAEADDSIACLSGLAETLKDRPVTGSGKERERGISPQEQVRK